MFEETKYVEKPPPMRLQVDEVRQSLYRIPTEMSSADIVIERVPCPREQSTHYDPEIGPVFRRYWPRRGRVFWRDMKG
jgi:hypothetical protein